MKKHRVLSRKIKLMYNHKHIYPKVTASLIDVSQKLALFTSTHPPSMKSSGTMTGHANYSKSPGTAISSVLHKPAK